MSNNNIDHTYEIKLAGKARDGNMEAFCELYGMYKDKLYRFALYRLGDPDDAEDAVSECVLAAWQSISSLRSTDAFGSWIFSILRNCCVRYIRRAVGLRENMEKLYEAGRSSDDAGPSASVELAEALAQLSDEEREIVILSAAAGLTSAEISGITGLTPGSVRSKLSRSLAKMREYLS